MLRQATELEQFQVRAIDGPIGQVQDLFFDDQRWVVRYFVLKTGADMRKTEVLISPATVSGFDWLRRLIPVALTREQVENGPELDPRLPVTREHEAALVHHYNWPLYWGAAGFPDLDRPEEGASDRSAHRRSFLTRGEAERGALTPAAVDGRASRLRSVRAVIGHAIEALTGPVGEVADFLMDDLTWEIRYLLVDTGSWWPGKKVLIAPHWIERVGCKEANVYVNLTREAIKGGPAYGPDQPLTPDFPGQLCRGREKPGNR
jgi:hypothetical protein